MSFDYDYLAVGHVTCDRIEDAPGGPREQPGGGAFYSALQAARLGLRTLIVTKGVPAQLERLLAPYRAELDVRVSPSEHTTTLSTRGSGPERVQRLCAWAGAIDEPLEPSARIVHLAPVARETPALLPTRKPSAQTPSALPAGVPFVGVTPQGLVRAWDREGHIAPTPLHRDMLPERLDAAVISERELESCAELLEREPPALVAITAGSDPIRLCPSEGTMVCIPAIAVPAPHDDLGAGDVFAAALFVALHGGSPPGQAARIASAAAAVRVSGGGPDAVGDRASIESALAPTP